MAFLRQEKKGLATYLRIVESYRDGDGKNRHRTLYNLGKAEGYSPEALKKIGQALYELGGGTIDQLQGRMLHELSRFYYGYPLVVKALLKTYSLDTFFDGVARNKSLGFNLSQSVNLLISERLHDPMSKRSNYKNQSDYLGLDQIELHQIYRTLDCLYENQEPIKTLIYNKGRNLFNQKLDLVFYDVTTFYFDSDKEDGFREKGFGKDGKIGNTIITFGLLIDKDKQPVGYEVYRGRQYEGHTFADAVGRLKEKYQIDKVICVADTGMMNDDNVQDIIDAEYEYIFGERFKNITHSKQEEILDLSKYSTIEVGENGDNECVSVKYMSTQYKGKRLIATYSAKRAAKDKAEREEKIAKAKTFLKDPSKLEKKAKIYFLKKEDNGKYFLDQEKISRSEKYDGFFCIATNNDNLPVDKILDAYKQLHRIEHSFRSFKTFLETRPMFHWTEKRILGHLALCYMSFTMLNYLQLKLQKHGNAQSENQIRQNLNKMQISLITQNDSQYYMRSKPTEGEQQITKVLSIHALPDLIPGQAIKQYV